MSSEGKNPIIKKIYPTAAELSSVNNSLLCLQEGCNQIFTSSSNLKMHVQKSHKKQELAKSEDCIYHHHCPETDCIYNATRHFKKMKYLKQHYLKIHANRSFICENCAKGFSTLAIKNTHSETCGVEFSCTECPMKYSSYESLITHGRRKKHLIAARSAFVRNPNPDVNITASETLMKQKVLIPKQTTSMQTIKVLPILLQVIKATDSVDKQIQTEPLTEFKPKPVKRRSNIFTQTCPRRKIRRSAETQTIGDCILKKAIQDAKVNLDENIEKDIIKRCMETQTKDTNWLKKGAGEHCSTQTISHEPQSKESSLSLETLSSDDLIHSSSQTSVNSLNYFEEFGNSQETQTDILYQDEFLQSSFNLANIQTQTNAELDLCSHMYTQTCDDQLLSDFGFSNIQTQTNWPDYDLFVSAETQTLLTQNTKGLFDMPLNGREISHMETQTDMEFKQLLEEINA